MTTRILPHRGTSEALHPSHPVHALDVHARWVEAVVERFGSACPHLTEQEGWEPIGLWSEEQWVARNRHKLVPGAGPKPRGKGAKPLKQDAKNKRKRAAYRERIALRESAPLACSVCGASYFRRRQGSDPGRCVSCQEEYRKDRCRAAARRSKARRKAGAGALGGGE